MYFFSKKIQSLLLIVLCGALCNCSTDEGQNNTVADRFDRKLLLANLADNIILPSYLHFQEKLWKLQQATDNFSKQTHSNNFQAVRAAWEDAYLAWQAVSMFEIGKAESLSYRNFMNVYPVDVEGIKNNIRKQTEDLNQITQQAKQGFAALDYLLFGLDENASKSISYYTTNVEAAQYKSYLQKLVLRMVSLTDQVVADWKGDFKADFISNSGSSATSSFDKIINDYIFHYEKHFRAGKIGISAGVFSNSILPTKTEAFYNGKLSKKLFLENLNAIEVFFKGKHFGKTDQQGQSLATYLDYLKAEKQNTNLKLSSAIQLQFDRIREKANALDPNFSSQIQTNNKKMLETYDEIQKNVISFKADMVSAFGILIDFVDADGD